METFKIKDYIIYSKKLVQEHFQQSIKLTKMIHLKIMLLKK